MSLRTWWSGIAAKRRELVGINRRNALLVYPNNPRRFYPIADDKLLAKEILEPKGVPMAPTLAICEGLFSIPSVLARLETEENFVVKPASGSGGAGILVVGQRIGERRWRRAGGAELSEEELQRHLADIVFGTYSKDLEDKAFVERRIEPHQMFRDLWADGLCDIRVITLKGRPLMSMVRVPTSQSKGKANLHQGGLGLAVDLETGRTFRAMSKGSTLEKHPETGAPLLGLQLPLWVDVLDVARRTADAVPLGYLGIDVVVDQHRGPLVLEINARPGLEIQNVNGRGLGAVLGEELS